MLLIAAFAINFIIVKRVHITRPFGFAGTRAHDSGIALLLPCLPVVGVIGHHAS